MLKKRSAIIGEYDTAAHGWTLTGYSLSAPEQKTNYADKPGGDGSWDLSTVMTDGVPRYKTRSLAITLELSEGDRASRSAIISNMVNLLDGMEWEIVLPDHPRHYVKGRVHVAVEYNDLAHAAVTLTGTCEPWLYSREETVVTRTAAAEAQTLMLYNNGRKVLIPQLTVDNGSILLEYGASSLRLTNGTYRWTTLVLTPGVHTLKYSGDGLLLVTYREAVLL